jgi:serine/threonine protein kinase
MIGRAFGPFQVTAKLGEGGMGEVYRARDGRLGRDVALKILPEAVASDPERLARFDREAKTLASLNHPHIAHLYGLEESGSTRALVLELIEGETLAERIARGPIAIHDALAMAKQIADALDAAHERSIVHRDLKPANIKLRPDGFVKVLDFGLAKVFTGEGTIADDSPTITAAATRAGTILGTAAYMSPEQARGLAVDKRTDIWAFGAVLYEMLTGRRAFSGNTTSDTIVAILEREPDWGALPRLTPPHIRQLLRRCLEKDLKRRLRDIGDVAIELSADAVEPVTAASALQPRRSLRTWVGTAALFAAIGAASTAIWLWPRRAEAPAFSALTAVPLTSYPGFESHPTLSPDGNQVAFTWNGERQNNFDIYVKLVGPGTPLQLTTDPAADTSPAWSPDGRWIAFLRVLPKGRAALMLVPALGGPERQLGEITITPFIAGPDIAYAICWSPDSASLFVPDRPSAAEAGGLFVWSVATGEKRRLTSSSADWSDLGPTLSPDGRTLAFTRFIGFGISDIYLLGLGEHLEPIGEPKRLTYQNRFATSPAWMPSGREIVFNAGSLTGGVASLFAVDVVAAGNPQNQPRRLGSVGEHGGLVTISRSVDGRSRLVYAQSDFDTGIWRIALPGKNTKTAESRSVPFLVSTRPEYQPHYSPDGQRIAFVSNSSGASEIWIADKDGANLIQLTTAAWPETAAPRWSPDGSQIAFHARPEGPGGIFTVPARGGAPKRLTSASADDWGASWSADSQWIYYTSNRSGRFEVWKVSSGGGTPVQFSKNGGFGPTASVDGRYVYYAKGSELWRSPGDSGVESRVLESLSDWSRFAVTDEGVYFSPGRSRVEDTFLQSTIEFLDFSTGRIRMVAQLDKPLFLGLTVSPDGRWLLYSQIDRSGTDLMLVDNVR